MRHLLFKLRWWYWFLSGPNIILMQLNGADSESVRIAMQRLDAKEPKVERVRG